MTTVYQERMIVAPDTFAFLEMYVLIKNPPG